MTVYNKQPQNTIGYRRSWGFSGQGGSRTLMELPPLVFETSLYTIPALALGITVLYNIQMARIVVGLVGPIAAGKSTIVVYLKNRGFSPYSLSDRIREEILARGLLVTRETLNKVSNELRETLGADILAKRTAELIDHENPERVVIDSIRNPQEVNFLRNHFGAKIIGLTAPQEKRFDFFIHRPINVEGVSGWEEFKALDDMELAQSGVYKQQVQTCLDLADIVIENNGTVEELEQRVETFITSV